MKGKQPRRQFDIVVLGATGYVGELICEHLAHNPNNRYVSVGIAGRNLQKLEEVRYRLEHIQSLWNGIAILRADIFDTASIRAVAQQTQVLVNCVGPYSALHGDTVVRTCIENDTDYIDVCAEPAHVARITQTFGAAAAARGVLIITAAGCYGALADMGIAYLRQQLPSDRLHSIDAYTALPGKVELSYGTWASVFTALTAVGTEPGRSAVTLRPHYIQVLRAWAVPWPVTTATVLRMSNGNDEEVSVGYAQYLRLASFTRLALLVLMIITAIAFLRPYVAQRAVLSPRYATYGPPSDRRLQSSVSLDLVATGFSRPKRVRGPRDVPDRRVVVSVRAGNLYELTAAVAVETALCVATDRDQLEVQEGVTSAGAALGRRLLFRFLTNSQIEVSTWDDVIPQQ